MILLLDGPWLSSTEYLDVIDASLHPPHASPVPRSVSAMRDMLCNHEAVSA